jgi:hypothetical protein
MCDMQFYVSEHSLYSLIMVMKFQKQLLPYTFSLLDVCAINTCYMLKWQMRIPTTL